jgi:hypothetical protein
MYIELGVIEQFITSTDSLGQKITLGIYLSVRILTYIIQIALIQSRHEKQPLKARGRHILFLLIFGTSFIEFIFMFRIVYIIEFFFFKKNKKFIQIYVYTNFKIKKLIHSQINQFIRKNFD